MNFKKQIKFIFLFLLFASLFTLYHFASLNIFPPNTDAATVLLLGKDMSEGNYLLHGWILSTVPFYFTEVSFYALASILFGYSSELAYIIPPAMYATVIFLIYRLSTNKLLALALIILYFALPSDMAVTSMLSACIHMGTYIFIMGCLIFTEKYIKTENILFVYFSTILSSMAIFSDNISTYIYVAPLTLSAMFLLYKERTKKYFIIIVGLLSSYLISKAIGFLFLKLDGFTLPGLSDVKIVEYDSILVNINTAVSGALLFFNATVFGEQITPSLHLLSKVIRLIGLVALIYFTVRNLFKNKSVIDICLSLSILIMTSAYIGSNLPRNIWTIRYLVPVFIMAVILLSRTKFNNKKIIYLIAFLGILSGIKTISINNFNNNRYNQMSCIRDKINEHKTNYGYAPFTFTNSVGINGDIKIANISFNNAKITRDNWLTNNEWHNKSNDFFILENQKQLNIVKKTYGTPEDIETVCDVIFVKYKNHIHVK
ncbi:hypothetical protein QY86_06295 [Salmonella enterica subsp. arizonae]|nr:hypothetical protein [Salmonella enterica subsp. arizonae]